MSDDYGSQNGKYSWIYLDRQNNNRNPRPVLKVFTKLMETQRVEVRKETCMRKETEIKR